MRSELDKKLVEKYPKIFKDRHGSPMETLMCFGFEHGDGWYNIIDALCANIQHTIDWSHTNNKWDLKWNEENPDNQRPVREIIPQVVAIQVKEKFGSLRFYTNGVTDEISGIIRMAESMSALTCEECGAPGRRRGRGWIYTACDTHTKPEHLVEEDEDENT